MFLVFILIKQLFFRKVSAKGKPPRLSGMKVMGIRNCVSVKLSATDLVW